MHPLLNERPPLVSLSQEDNTDNPFTPPSPGLFSGSTGALLHTQCPTLTCIHQGKVRDIYAISPTTLLMVATDRISALDVVMKNGIPGKGQLLTSLSLFWFDYLKDILPNHVVTSHLHEMPLVIQEYQEMVEHRSMLVRKLRMVPVEAVVRGYLTGALWKAYQKMETYAGLQLPPGLKEGQKLPTPVFTPTTKAKVGDHDEPITFEQMKVMLGDSLANLIKKKSFELFEKASEHADARGLILVDTKFEFGQDEGTHDVYLADEVLTPDSTRYWLKSTYPVDGQHLPDPRSWLVGVASLDKQPLRDYLKRGGGGGNEEKEEDGHRFDLKAGQGIEVPMHLVKELQVKYATCLAMLTGRS